MAKGTLSLVEFRRYEARDHEAVRRLHDTALHAIAAHAGRGPWDDDLDSVDAVYLESGGEFLVGVLDRAVIAMGALRPISATVAEVKRMRVEPGLQGRGLGRQMLVLLEREALARGFEQLQLDTSEAMIAALGLYTSAGYREVKRTTLGPLEMIFMTKRLSAY